MNRQLFLFFPCLISLLMPVTASPEEKKENLPITQEFNSKKALLKVDFSKMHDQQLKATQSSFLNHKQSETSFNSQDFEKSAKEINRTAINELIPYDTQTNYKKVWGNKINHSLIPPTQTPLHPANPFKSGTKQ